MRQNGAVLNELDPPLLTNAATATLKISAKSAKALMKLGRRSRALRVSVTATSGTLRSTRSAVVVPR